MEKKDSYYFQHDFYARQDPKLVNLMMRHGMAGIGIFWCVAEMLYEQGGRLDMGTIDSIAFSLHTESSLVEAVIKDFELFHHNDDVFWSESIDKRIGRQEDIRKKRIDAVKKRWEKHKAKVVDDSEDDVVITASEAAEAEKAERVNYDGVVKFWNHGISTNKSQMSAIKDIDEGTKRRENVRARIKQHGKQVFADVLMKAQRSDFLNGRSGGVRTKVFNFDWVILPNNFVKIRDGNYDNDKTVINDTANRTGVEARQQRADDAASAVAELLTEGR